MPPLCRPDPHVPPSAEGTPGDLAAAENPSTGRGAGARRGAAGLSGAEEEERRVPGCPPRRREGWERVGLPLRTAAPHCSRRRSRRGRILPGSCGTGRDAVPRGQWGQPGGGPLRPRCWQGQGLSPPGVSPPGVSHTSCAPVLPYSPTPIVPSMAGVSLGRACRSSTCKAGGWLPSGPFTADKIQISLPCVSECPRA